MFSLLRTCCERGENGGNAGVAAAGHWHVTAAAVQRLSFRAGSSLRPGIAAGSVKQLVNFIFAFVSHFLGLRNEGFAAKGIFSIGFAI